MASKHYLIVLFCCWMFFGFAHDANKAFFTIKQKDTLVEVRAEFPWSIRNALLEAYPNLENSKLQDDYENAFFKYVNTNFKLSYQSERLSLLTVDEIVSQGHTHQNDFVFVFNGDRFDEVTNTLMHNIYENQKNYHKIESGIDVEFITSDQNLAFKIDAVSDSNWNLKKDTIVIFIVLVFTGLITVFYLKRKRSIV